MYPSNNILSSSGSEARNCSNASTAAISVCVPPFSSSVFCYRLQAGFFESKNMLIGNAVRSVVADLAERAGGMFIEKV
jgi:hypothetical protein